MAVTPKDIKGQVTKGNHKKAIDMLLDLTDSLDEDLHSSAIMLAGRFNSLQRDQMSGLIDAQQANLRTNQITFALIHLLGEIEDDWTEPNDGGKLPSNTSVKTILFLAANPKGTSHLRLDEEVRRIDQGLQRSKHRDAFHLVQKWAVQIPDLRRAFLDNKPNFVHFSGHGSPEGRVILESAGGNAQELDPKGLGEFFELFSSSVHCVVLNACYSESQAQEIVKHIPYVVGMNTAVPDKAAIEFSEAFYDAIANGEDVEFAFRLGKNSIRMYDLRAEHIPILLKKS